MPPTNYHPLRFPADRTDEQAAVYERQQADKINSPGHIRCSGYPVGHYCIVLLAVRSGRSLCNGCERTREETQRTIRAAASSIPTVGEILESLPDFEQVDACECGGDRNADYHEQSLLHMEYLRRG